MHCQASVKCLLEDGEQQGVDEALYVTAVADKQPRKDHFSIQTTHQSVILGGQKCLNVLGTHRIFNLSFSSLVVNSLQLWNESKWLERT